MDNERTKTTSEMVSEKYTSDIVYVSELVSKYEHELIRRDDIIKQLQSDKDVLEKKFTSIKDRLFDCMYELKCHTKQLTKSELIEKITYFYGQLLEIKELF